MRKKIKTNKPLAKLTKKGKPQINKNGNEKKHTTIDTK